MNDNETPYCEMTFCGNDAPAFSAVQEKLQFQGTFLNKGLVSFVIQCRKAAH